MLSAQICRHAPTSQQLTVLQPSQPCSMIKVGPVTRAEHQRGDDHSAQLSTHCEVKRDTSTAVHAGLPQIDDRAPSGRQETHVAYRASGAHVSNPRIQTAAPHLLVVSRRCSSSGTCQSAAGGPDCLGRGCWLRAGGMRVLAPRRWAGPRRKGTSSGQGPVAQARHAGVGYSHRDASLDGPPAMAGRPVRPCFRAQMGLGMRSSLRRPRRLAVLGIARRRPAHDVLRAPRAVQWPMPRTAC